MSKLSNNESTGDFTHIIKLDYSQLDDIKTATDSQKVIATIPAGGAVTLVGVYESTALVGASDITIDIGTTSGDPDEFINALDVDGMTVPVFNTGDAFTTLYMKAVSPVAADTDIILEVNGTTGSLTAGEVIIGIKILDLGRFA